MLPLYSALLCITVMPRNYVDFEIIKEPWNKYSISDGSEIKTRFVLKSVWHTLDNGKIKKFIEPERFIVIMCDPSLQGMPSSEMPNKSELLKNIEVNNSRYTTTSYDANEYLLDEGTRILVHNNITKISRTTLYDIRGNRMYDVDLTENIIITPQSP